MFTLKLTLRKNVLGNQTPPVIPEDEGEFSYQDCLKEDLDQEISEEANYQETMRGVSLFMHWHQVLDFDTSSSSLDDYPCAGTSTTHDRQSIFQADEWLCKKLEKLNITITECYPSRSSETSGLLKDQFGKTPKTLKWYNMYSEKKVFSRSKVFSWSSDPPKLNSSFSRVANHCLLPHHPGPSTKICSEDGKDLPGIKV